MRRAEGKRRKESDETEIWRGGLKRQKRKTEEFKEKYRIRFETLVEKNDEELKALKEQQKVQSVRRNLMKEEKKLHTSKDL